MNSIARDQDGVKPERRDPGSERARMYADLLRHGTSREDAVWIVDASFMTAQQLRQHYPDRKAG